MTMYLNSFWNAGFWSALLVGMISVAFRLASLQFEPFLALLAWLGAWLAILLLTRTRLVASDMVAAAALRPTLGAAAESSEASPAGTRNYNPALNYICAGLARTMVFVPLTSDRDVDTADFGVELREAVQTINLWYWPVQALVWATPAIGFIGSAWQMRRLMYLTLEHSAKDRVLDVDTLLSMAPIVVDGLTIICVALALSAAAHVATSLVFRRDLLSVSQLRAALTNQSVSPARPSGGTRSQRTGPRPIKDRP